MRGADALTRALERAGVDTIFGVPGGAALPVYDALYDSPIRHVLMRHEQSAGHAAEGYARASGKPGVALGTSGPGATNFVTAIADAQMDSTPTLFITGQVKTTLRGTNAFQEADVIGITQPIVKHSIAIERPDDIAQAVQDALHIATSGRPGPVLIDLPTDMASAPAREEIHDTYLPGYRPRHRPNGRQVRIAAEAIAMARRPVLYAGGGVTNADAAEELRTFAKLTAAPVTTTLMALGAFPASDPAWLGMLGMHGTRVANWAMDEADLIVAIGARFDDRVTGAVDEFAPHAKIVHIDIDPTEIGKIIDVHVPLVGDAKLVLEALTTRLREARTPIPAASPRGGRGSAAGRPTIPRAPRSRSPAAWTPSSRWTSSRASSATRSSPPTSASTRCGRRTACSSTSRASGSRAAGSGRWASASRPRSAPRPRIPAGPSSACPAKARS